MAINVNVKSIYIHRSILLFRYVFTYFLEDISLLTNLSLLIACFTFTCSINLKIKLYTKNFDCFFSKIDSVFKIRSLLRFKILILTKNMFFFVPSFFLKFQNLRKLNWTLKNESQILNLFYFYVSSFKIFK